MGKVNLIDSEDLHRRLEAGEAIQLIDVREPDEVALCAIPGSIHLPMHQVAQRYVELDPKAETVVYCHHGMRSQMVAGFLAQQGFLHVANLHGGIDAWAAAVDPEMARY